MDDDFPHGVERNETLTILGETRAMRRLLDQPVPTELIDTLIWAGTRAASPNNTQLWHFVVVTDPDVRRRIGDAVTRFLKWIDRLPPPADDSDAHIRNESRYLLSTIAEAPVLLFVCGEHRYPEIEPDVRYLWSAVNTASQNVLTAARSLGLGATLTMLQVGNEPVVREILGLPDHVEIGTVIPIGWPDRSFGPVRRRPVAEVTHHDRW